jgi:ketosteroid isomerase-like protein
MISPKPLILLAITLFIYLPAYSQTYVGDQKDIDQILQNIENFSKYYMNEDFDKLASAYTMDGKILPPGTDIIEGREAIKQRWLLPNGVDIPLHKVTPTEINVIGDYAYDLGYYEGKTKRPNGEVFDFSGKYVIVWKKVEGEWKIYIDMWNDRDD